MVCYLFIGSWTFSSVFSYLGGHEVIEHWVLAANLSATGFLILAQFIIFLLGWPLEWTEIIIIFVPIFLPLVKTFHIDPTLFGILVALNIQTSFNTPPMAMAAYYLKGVAPPQVQAEPDFRRRAAVRVHGVPDHGPGLHLPGHCALAAQQDLRELMAADERLTSLTAIEAAERIAGGDISARGVYRRLPRPHCRGRRQGTRLRPSRSGRGAGAGARARRAPPQRPADRPAARRSGRASKTSSIPPITRPNAARRCSRAASRCATARRWRGLREAGAVIIGKTVTTEFAYFHPGPTRNPHDL